MITRAQQTSTPIALRMALDAPWTRYTHCGREPDSTLLRQVLRVIEWIRAVARLSGR